MEITEEKIMDIGKRLAAIFPKDKPIVTIVAWNWDTRSANIKEEEIRVYEDKEGRWIEEYGKYESELYVIIIENTLNPQHERVRDIVIQACKYIVYEGFNIRYYIDEDDGDIKIVNLDVLKEFR